MLMFSGTVEEILCSMLLSKKAIMPIYSCNFSPDQPSIYSNTFSQKKPLKNSLENRTINEYRSDFAKEAFPTVDQVLLFSLK